MISNKTAVSEITDIIVEIKLSCHHSHRNVASPLGNLSSFITGE